MASLASSISARRLQRQHSRVGLKNEPPPLNGSSGALHPSELRDNLRALQTELAGAEAIIAKKDAEIAALHARASTFQPAGASSTVLPADDVELESARAEMALEESKHETSFCANTSNAKVDGAGGVPVSAMPALMTECVTRQAFADMASIRTFHADTDIPADAVYFVQKGDVSLRISLGLQAKGYAHDADPPSGASDVVDLTSVPVGGMFNHERLIAVSNVSARAGKQGCTLIAMALDKLQRVASPTGQRCADALCELIFGPMAVVATLSYQQLHNCCSITALALALSTLGHTTEPTDIALMAGVSASYLNRAGLTLGELFNVANAYLHKADLLAPYASQQQQQQPAAPSVPAARDDASAGVEDHTGYRAISAISGKLHCECYHFDASIVSFHAFRELLHNDCVWQHAAPAAASNGDVPTLMSSLVANFHVRTSTGLKQCTPSPLHVCTLFIPPQGLRMARPSPLHVCTLFPL